MRRALLALLAGCSFYNPDLGDRPFQCGTDEPRCPDGYAAVDIPPTRCECQRSASLPDSGPAYECASPASYEPDESIGQAAPTLLGMSGNTTWRSEQTSICGFGDADVYKMNVPAADTVVTVDVTFDTTRQPPKVEILDGIGASIGGPDTSPAPGHVVASKKVGAMGTYYARVTAPQDVNYSAVLTLVPSQP
jgi:hypothetical protein